MLTDAISMASIMLITANVGSIFEDPNGLLKIWIAEFLKKIESEKPFFFAIHCQEVGGKTYEESMKHVDSFIRQLMESEALSDYDRVALFLDEDFTSTEKFTALGNIYFVHRSLKDVNIFNFKDKHFEPIEQHLLYTGNIEEVSYVEKSKFPQEFFPECKWSRKGFMRTRWSFAGTKFDLVNIHLFHDASNLIAMQNGPSTYSQVREKALRFTIDRFSTDEYEKVPLFMFGDFNFRLDSRALIQNLTKDCSKTFGDGKAYEILFTQKEDTRIYLTVGKKTFDLENHDEYFFQDDDSSSLNEFDNELASFNEILFELPKNFPPSYPFTEDAEESKYMRTRCPSWCDRVLFNQAARDLIFFSENQTSLPKPVYSMIGKETPMGDHKPIALLFFLKIHPMEKEATSLLREGSNLNKAACENILDNDKQKVEIDPSLLSHKNIEKNDLSVKNFARDPSPSLFRAMSKPEISDHSQKPIPKDRCIARRMTASGTDSQEKKDVFNDISFHDEDWYKKTQQIFMNMRKKQISSSASATSFFTFGKQTSTGVHSQNLKRRLESECSQISNSRLTSHHSSSDEEWYTDIQEKLHQLQDNEESCFISNPPPTRTATMTQVDLSHQTLIGAIKSLQNQPTFNSDIGETANQKKQLHHNTNIVNYASKESVCTSFESLKQSAEEENSGAFGTRYVYVKQGDRRIAVFRETAV